LLLINQYILIILKIIKQKKNIFIIKFNSHYLRIYSFEIIIIQNFRVIFFLSKLMYKMENKKNKYMKEMSNYNYFL
jgi:hypothetical protein